MRFPYHKVAAAAVAALGASAMAQQISGNGVSPNRQGSNYTSGTVAQVTMTGSSAIDPTLTKFFAHACDAGTLDVYRGDAGTRTFFLWTCENTSTSGFTFASGATKIAFTKNTGSSTEGTTCLLTNSGSGTSSVSSCNNTSIAFITPGDIGSTSVNQIGGCTGQTIPATGSIPAYKLFTCGTTVSTSLNSVNPLFGFSDNEPQQFSALSNTALNQQLGTESPVSLIFGIPVSTALRNAMQSAQGLTMGDDSEAQMPTMSLATLNQIFTGGVTTWSAAGVSTTAQAAAGIGEDNIYLLRRGGGSGSTRIWNEEVVGENCSPGVTASVGGTSLPAANPATACVSGATRVWQAGVTEDLLACIANFNAAPIGAMGYASTDFVSGQNGSPDGYRFIKINGFAPTNANAMAGKYTMWSEVVMNHSKARSGSGAAPQTWNGAAFVDGDNTGFFNRFKAASANAQFIGDVSAALANLGGWTGAVLASSAGSGGKQPSGWGLPAVGTGIYAGREVQDHAGRVAALVPASTYLVNPFTRQQGSTRWNLCDKPNPQQPGYIGE